MARDRCRNRLQRGAARCKAESYHISPASRALQIKILREDSNIFHSELRCDQSNEFRMVGISFQSSTNRVWIFMCKAQREETSVCANVKNRLVAEIKAVPHIFPSRAVAPPAFIDRLGVAQSIAYEYRDVLVNGMFRLVGV